MFKWFFSGGLIPLLLAVSGIFLAVYLRGLPFCAPRKMLAALLAKNESGGDTSPFRALMLALAGTLGVGNIVGVANAIRIGGAGAVFWMWVVALLGMVIKFCEVTLAIRFRKKSRDGEWQGGPMYYIRHGMGKKYRLLSVSFAVFAISSASRAYLSARSKTERRVSFIASRLLRFLSFSASLDRRASMRAMRESTPSRIAVRKSGII